MSIDDFAQEKVTVDSGNSEQVPQMEGVDQPRGFAIPEFLKAKTGSGSVGDYIDHPMNLKKNEHFARMLRGFTGMFNALDYAIIDVVIGAVGFLKKSPVQPPVSP